MPCRDNISRIGNFAGDISVKGMNLHTISGWECRLLQEGAFSLFKKYFQLNCGMLRLVIVGILCLIFSTSFAQDHSGIDSIVSLIQKTDNCTISYDSSTFRNGYGSITCFYQNKKNQKLSRVTEKTNLRVKNKKITRNYYFSNDNLIKVDVEESSDCCGTDTKTFYYSIDSNSLSIPTDKGSGFYLSLSKVIQKSFYKKNR